MGKVILAVFMVALVADRAAEPAESFEALVRYGARSSGDPSRDSRRALGRVGIGAQLGGFFDPKDPSLELRGWARRVGISLSWGRHAAEPSASGFTEIDSRAGKQVTGGLLVAFNHPKPDRSIPIRVYGTAGIVHTTQARGVWKRDIPDRDGIVGEAGVEGSTGYWPFVGAGAEMKFARLGGLAVGSELLFAVSGGEGVGPGLRFSVRYYVW